MGDQFDPYHQWLGIAPFEQPANHYRLLGIPNFESDKDVIDTAAEQRMSYLQMVCEGDDIAIAQQLLNEVSNARLTLLSDEKKRAYDEGLQHGLETAPVAKHSAGRVSDVEISPVRSASRIESASGKRRTNKTGWPAPALVLIAVLAAAMLSMAGLLLFRSGSAGSTPSRKPPVVTSAAQKQEGVPNAQHDVLSAQLDQKKPGIVAPTGSPSTAALRGKDMEESMPSVSTKEGSPSGASDAEFPIGALRDTSSEARVESRNIDEHVDAEPAGDQWRCRFRLSGFGEAEEAVVVGSFTDWEQKPEQMQRHDGAWEATVTLLPGEHQYKFIVDGQWQPDRQDNYQLQLPAPDVQPNAQPEAATASRKQSMEDARTILEASGLHESEEGVWSLQKQTNFSQREYELLKNDRNVMRALKTVQGRLAGQQ